MEYGKKDVNDKKKKNTPERNEEESNNYFVRKKKNSISPFPSPSRFSTTVLTTMLKPTQKQCLSRSVFPGVLKAFASPSSSHCT